MLIIFHNLEKKQKAFFWALCYSERTNLMSWYTLTFVLVSLIAIT
jgi:hypothetical protein